MEEREGGNGGEREREEKWGTAQERERRRDLTVNLFLAFWESTFSLLGFCELLLIKGNYL